MTLSCPEIKESILLSIKIVNSEPLTEFDNTPKGTHQF
jgi:hypothetical protein